MAMPDRTLGALTESPLAHAEPRPYPAIPRALDRLNELTEHLAKVAQVMDERTMAVRTPSEEKWGGLDEQPDRQPAVAGAIHEYCDRIETTIHRLQGIVSEIQL